MSTTNVSQYLVELQRLTQTNLSILKTINESFTSKKDHLAVQVDGSQYVIPSYISLENKINALQENFYNLINSPKTGEAYFNLDGNTQQIVVQGFNNTPPMSTFATRLGQAVFGIEQNDVFKDFLTPIPYMEFDLSDMADDIVSVNVRKIVPRNAELKALFASYFENENDWSAVQNEADVRKAVDDYKEDVDYVMYDTVMKLPVRKGSGTATYVIEEVVDDWVDDDLIEHVTLKLRNNLTDPTLTNTLTYKRFEDLIEVPLQVGDEIVTYNESCKMQIETIVSKSNTITVSILNDVYMNLAGTTTDDMTKIADICKLKFFKSIDADSYKKVRVPLEEDQYVFIAIAPLCDRLNTQASWGTGVVLNTEKLQPVGDTSFTYTNYYKENVRNIGDILYEITSMLSNTLSSLTYEDIKAYQSFSPTLTDDTLEVVQINKHLNDSTTVKNIRSLYSQKKQLQADLSEVQAKITEINDSIAKINFDDTSNLRSALTGQLTEFNNRRNDLVASLTTITNQISIEANNSTVPIENAKYRIRGFVSINNGQVPVDESIQKDGKLDASIIKGLKVQYRYKNVDQAQGTAVSIAAPNAETFIFSDWNELDNPLRPRLVEIDSETNSIKYPIAEDNGAYNEPSFNQIDIPITQGETVDIRVKFLYDFGYPFVELTSDWSQVLNVAFPEEYEKDVQILDIIEENNNDIETNRFQNMIDNQGITSHVGDKVVDQDITYFHKPENIASGFYTDERRVIPLRDKLSEMAADITSLIDEVRGTSADDINVAIQNGDTVFSVLLNQDNLIALAAYDTLTAKQERVLDGTYIKDSNGKVSTFINIVLSNVTTHVIKLYSLFPGNDSVPLTGTIRSFKFDPKDYCGVGGQWNDTWISEDDYRGVWIGHMSTDVHNSDDSDVDVNEFRPQTLNQFLTFRTIDAYMSVDGQSLAGRSGEFYKESTDTFEEGDIFKSPFLSADKAALVLRSVSGTVDKGMAMYPFLSSENGLSINASSINNSMYVQIPPGQNIVIPIMVEYNMDELNDETQYRKTMSFDLRTSLYQDPLTYTFTVVTSKKPTAQSSLIQSNRNTSTLTLYQPTVTK